MVAPSCASRVLATLTLVLLASACAGEPIGVESGLHKIVFASDRGLPPKAEEESYDTRRLDLYVMDASGRNVRRLTHNFATDVFPYVSRDGRQIAFTRDIGGFAQVFVMDTHGGHVRMLTHGRANSGLPSWSPDGRRIVFATETPGAAAIYVVNADSTGLRRLTRDKQALDTQPAWSPDGKQIVYESDIFMLPGQIFVMRADGTQRRQLTDPTVGASSRPSWSSDGRQIVFMASRARHTAVWTMRPDGTRQKQLTRGRGFDGFPAAG